MEFQNQSVQQSSLEHRTELFNTYVLPHINLIYRLCIKYTYHQDDIEDNYVEVLANFFKYIETYDPSRSVQTWLHIVTKRFVGDMNLKNSQFKKNNDVGVDMLADKLIDDDNISINCFQIEDYKEHYNDEILHALHLLRPIYREALLLQQAGYRLHEIVEISYANGNLKVKNIETIKSRLFLAKQQLRELITRDGKAKTDTQENH